MLRLSLSLWLSFISIPPPIFRVRNPSRQSNVANQVCVSQPVRYGMWSSFQDAPCRKLAQTLLVPLVGHAAWLPCYLGASSRPNPADHYVRKRSITCAFFLSVLSRKSDTTSRLAAQWKSVLSRFMGITRTFTCACQMVARERDQRSRCSFQILCLPRRDTKL